LRSRAGTIMAPRLPTFADSISPPAWIYIMP